jgi:hypothetical protein
MLYYPKEIVMDERERQKRVSKALLAFLRTGGHHFIDTPWGSIAQDSIVEEHGKVLSYKKILGTGIKYDFFSFSRRDVVNVYVDECGHNHIQLGR